MTDVMFHDCHAEECKSGKIIALLVCSTGGQMILCSNVLRAAI